MANIKGITIEIDGNTTKLDKALKDVNNTSREVNKELRGIKNSLKFNPKSTELMTQKQRVLGESIENTKKKLDQLKEAQAQAARQLENGDLGQAEYDALRREIIKTENQLKSLSRQQDEITNKWKVAGQSMQDFGGKMDKAGQSVSSAGKEMTTKVSVPLAAVGAASFKMAADTQDAMGATDQIFKKSSKEMKSWASSLPSHYGIAKGEALEYSNTMGAMLKNIGGLSEAEAAKQSQILTELAGDLSAMYGGTTESAIQALTGALKGNNAMLDNYGIGVNEATIKTKALEMGIYDGVGALSLEEKQAATLALIMEQTADAQGQAGREAEGASGSFKAFTTIIKDITTEIGDNLLPILTPMLQKFADFIKGFKDLSPETKNFIVTLGLIAAAIGPVMMVLGPVISLIGKIIGAIGIVSQVIGVMSSGIAVASPVVMGIVGVLTKLGAVFGIIKGAIIAFAAALNLPVLAIVAIGAAIAGLVYLIVTHWEEIKAKTIEIWTGITTWISDTWNNFIATIQPVWETIVNVFTVVWLLIQEVFRAGWMIIESFLIVAWQLLIATARMIFGPLVTFFTGIWTGIQNGATTAWSVISGFLSGIWNGIKNTASTIFNGLKNLIQGVWNGIKSVTSTAWNAIKKAIEDPINKAKDAVQKAIDKMKSILNITLPFPKIKLPHFKIEGSFSLNPPRVPSFGVEWYDKGGIFSSPSIIGVGEKRPEFVGALDDLKTLIREVLEEKGVGGDVDLSGIRDGQSTLLIKELVDEVRNLIYTVGNKDIVVAVGDREIARATYKYVAEFTERDNKMRSRRRGEV